MEPRPPLATLPLFSFVKATSPSSTSEYPPSPKKKHALSTSMAARTLLPSPFLDPSAAADRPGPLGTEVPPSPRGMMLAEEAQLGDDEFPDAFIQTAHKSPGGSRTGSTSESAGGMGSSRSRTGSPVPQSPTRRRVELDEEVPGTSRFWIAVLEAKEGFPLQPGSFTKTRQRQLCRCPSHQHPSRGLPLPPTLRWTSSRTTLRRRTPANPDATAQTLFSAPPSPPSPKFPNLPPSPLPAHDLPSPPSLPPLPSSTIPSSPLLPPPLPPSSRRGATISRAWARRASEREWARWLPSKGAGARDRCCLR